MDLVYKIYSVYLYDNQLSHEYVFFYNRSKSFIGDVNWDAPYDMFGSSTFCANTIIYNLDKKDPQFKQKSIEIMLDAAKSTKTLFIKASDFISLEKLKPTHLPNYNIYDILWNETKSGINPHEYEVMGIWNPGSSQYSSYRIWEEKEERLKAIRDNQLNQILKK
jgi:hypothetical protein